MATKDLTMLQMDPFCLNHWAVVKEEFDTLTKAKKEKLRKEKGVLFVIPRELWDTLVDAVTKQFWGDSDYADYFVLLNPEFCLCAAKDKISHTWADTHYRADADDSALHVKLRATSASWKTLLGHLSDQMQEAIQKGVLKEKDVQRNFGVMKAKSKIQKFIEHYDGNKLSATTTAILDKNRTAPVVMDTPNIVGHMLCFLNGLTYDFKTRTVHPSTPADHSTHVAPVSYDPHANDKEMVDFIDKITNHRPETKRYLMQLLGLALDESMNAKAMVFILGPQNNGKTSLMEVIMGTLGMKGEACDGYCGSINPQDLTPKAMSGGKCTSELDNICGTRIVSVTEGNNKSIPDCATLKRLSGSSTVTANPKYKAAYSTTFHGTLFWDSNTMIPLDDPVMYTSGRVHIVLLDHVFTPEERDMTIVSRLLASESARSTLVNMIIQGYNDFIDCGNQFAIPQESLDAIEQLRSMSDPISAFLSDLYIKTDVAKDRIKVVDAFHLYNMWLAKKGYNTVERNVFVTSLKKKVNISSYGNCACFEGFHLKAPER